MLACTFYAGQELPSGNIPEIGYIVVLWQKVAASISSLQSYAVKNIKNLIFFDVCNGRYLVLYVVTPSQFALGPSDLYCAMLSM
jgi:hypothetical protein